MPHSGSLNLNHCHFPESLSPINGSQQGPLAQNRGNKLLQLPAIPIQLHLSPIITFFLPFTLKSSTSLGQEQPLLLCFKSIGNTSTYILPCPFIAPFLYSPDLKLVDRKAKTTEF